MSFHLIREGKASDGDIWPLAVDTSAGGYIEATSWRQFGMSWFAGAFDDVGGLERTSRFTERLAGMLHLDPNAIVNEAKSGAALMDAKLGWGNLLKKVKPISSHQQWQWECNRFGVESLGYGVNDIGTGGIQDSGFYWPEQRNMWNYVWANTVRSCIQRFIAGAIYFADSTGLSPAVWHNPGPVADFSFLPKGPGGSGLGHWQWKLDPDYGTSGGYWWTDQNGDEMWLVVPVDYDTGTVSVRHLCPGSWFDGPAEVRNPFGVVQGSAPDYDPPGTPEPKKSVRLGAEHPRAPSAVTVTAPGYAGATVNCQGLANRFNFSGIPGNWNLVNTGNPGPGVIGPEGVMTHVSRHALTPIPGDTQLVKVTVGGLPSGGWYGFDSWEIQAIPMLRPIVPVANVANPADLGLYLWSADMMPTFSARCQDFSDVISNVVAEYADPGIMVVDIRAAIATVPQVYAYLKDAAGATVEISSGTGNTGDGTHPHALGQRLLVGVFVDTILKANLPRGRGALPFAPARALAYARSSGTS